MMTTHTDFNRPAAAVALLSVDDLLARAGYDRRPSPGGGRDVQTLQQMTAAASEFLRRFGEALDLDAASARDCAEQALTLIQTRRQCSPATGGLAPWQAKRVVAFIDENLSRKILVEDLANLVRLSESHFARAFTKNFGVPPRTYLIGRRVELAKRLMRSTKDALCQIALECGFADQAHLSRVFRSLVGLPPHAWRVAQRRISAETE